MGNHNSSGSPRKAHENKKLANSDSGKVEKTCVKGPRKRRRRRRCGQVSDNFIIHGIDYLPESVKRKERKKKNVPKFIFFEDHLWQVNRLNFFARFQNGHSHGNGSTVDHKMPEKEPKAIDADPSLVTSSMTRSKTACAGFSEEKIMDWRTYPDYPFRNIVMSGGGSKGYAYIGSLKALEDCGILKNISKVAGSSAGAICAGLLAVGCTPQEIADVFKCDIKWLFHDQTCACCCCLPRVCNKFGIHPAKRFHEIYGEHLKKKVGNPDITFLQLKELMNRELCIVVTNLSRMCSEYFNHKTTPDLPIRDAVRMSMAFPVVFRAVRYTLSGRECVYTDGGLLDQYPIHCFDDLGSDSANHSSEDDDNNEEKCDDFEGSGLPNMATLGLYVVSEKPIDHKIWLALFGQEIPCKPTYLPNTKLARERLEKEMAKRKMHNKKFDKQEFMDELCSSVGDGAKDVLDHYEIWNKSHVDIRNFGEYFIATLETLLISQRKLRIKINDSLRTVAINCGYIGTNDYVIEPGDREFMIDQGYTGTVRYLREFIASRNSSATLRKKKVPRSRSSNMAEQYRIRDELMQELTSKSTNAHGNTNPHTRYFLSEEDSDDRPAEENVIPTDLDDFDLRQNLRETGEKTSDLESQSRKSSKNSEIKVSNEMVGEFFLDSLRYSLPVEGLERTRSRESNAISSIGPSAIHLMNMANGGETVHKKSFESFPSDRCDSKRLPASVVLSASSESEGYEELVCRTLAALDRSEIEPVLESKV